MQPSPSIQQGYDDGRWRSNIEGKIDKALELLNGLNTQYLLLNSRVTTLENEPKKQQEARNLSVNQQVMLIAFCSTAITIVGVLLQHVSFH